MKCYKIRHIPTNTFVTKTWNKLHHVQSHIRLRTKRPPHVYGDGNYELIEYEMKEIGTKPI